MFRVVTHDVIHYVLEAVIFTMLCLGLIADLDECFEMTCLKLSTLFGGGEEGGSEDGVWEGGGGVVGGGRVEDKG